MLSLIKENKVMKNLLAVIVIFMIVFAGLWVIANTSFGFSGGYETGEAKLDDLVKSKSTRRVQEVPVVTSDASPYHALVSTPIALYYDNEANRHVSPLIVADPEEPSSSPLRFLDMYGRPEVYGIGDVDIKDIQINNSIEGDVKALSLAAATFFWEESDGVMLVHDGFEGHKMGDGYNSAVSAATLASYLNIPVIVTEKLDAKVVKVLKRLGVKYSIVCGDMTGYKKTMRFDDLEDRETWDHLVDVTIGVVEKRLGQNISYITLANPLDTYRKEVVEELDTEHFEGSITNSDAAAYPGAAPAAGNENPIHYFDIPPDYEYANVCFDMYIDTSQEQAGDASGARMYAYIGVDGNEDKLIDVETQAEDRLYFFGGTPGYENIGPNGMGNPLAKNDYGHLYIELPMYNERDEKGNPLVNHAVQLLARLPTDFGDNGLPDGADGDYESTYTLDITVEKLAEPTYPLMEDLSCMAPYLTAYRMGVVLARPKYQLHDLGYIGCSSSGNPAANKDILDDANHQVWEIKNDLDYVLGKLANIDVDLVTQKVNTKEGVEITTKVPDKTREELADHYGGLPVEERPHIGIIADTNMIPQYYYVSKGQGDATEGFGIPSDIIYQDIDVSRDKPPLEIDGSDPSMELPAGRVGGWDAQDVSALIARTFFYSEIIEDYRGPYNGIEPRVGEFWKDSGFTSIGTEPPVGPAETTAKKLSLMFEAAGLSTKTDVFIKQDECRRQRAGPYYESSNFIYFCAHGFYYWYVPPAVEGSHGPLPAIGAGGAFDVAHVKDMSFGPSVLWASSCVTGRIDGLDARICLSQAFLHAGLNAYVGATRMSWGSLLPIPDAASGEGLGDLMSMYFYAHLTGKLYDKAGGMISFEPGDLTTGQALMLAKNGFVESEGSDGGGVNDDTLEEFILHGDPAFNPYEPNH